MTKKKYIGQIVSIKYADRKEIIYGFVIDYNKDWTLMKYNPVDYIIDGYIILRHKNIEGFRRDVEEKWREKVIKLKGIDPTEKEIIPIVDLKTILNYITDNFGVFNLYLKSERACYLGKIKSLNSEHLTIYYLNPKGNWDEEMKFRPGDIRVIEFDTDYINSLKLVLGNKKPKGN